MRVLGWTSAYTSPYRETAFTSSHKQALIECVRKRHYDFTYNDLCFLQGCAPIFGDYTVSIPSRADWDEILHQVYEETPRTHRLIPPDAIKRQSINDIFYEHKEDEPKVGESDR